MYHGAVTDAAGKPAVTTPSPCVRNCCLDEDDVCLGCHRTIAEICSWSAASEEQKREILERCQVRAEERKKKGGAWKPRGEW